MVPGVSILLKSSSMSLIIPQGSAKTLIKASSYAMHQAGASVSCGYVSSILYKSTSMNLFILQIPVP